MTAPPQSPSDTITTLFPVRPLIPQTYDELMQQELATDLDLPSNISTTAEFDPQLGCYVIRTRLGESDIVTPFYLTPQQNNSWQTPLQRQDYFRLRIAEALTTPAKET